MLLFPIRDLPRLGNGKGNKIINIPTARAKTREELMSILFVLPADGSLVILAGRRTLTLKPGNLADFMGKRGQRGRKLPRGFQHVSRLETEASSQRALL